MSEDLSASGFLLLESGTLHHKTNARDRKDAILPLIAVGTGQCGRLEAMRGVSFKVSRNSLKMQNLSKSQRPLSCAHMALQEPGCSHGRHHALHVIKFELGPMLHPGASMSYEQRLTQGHHVSPKHGMALLYSRDAFTEILVQVA